VIGIREDRGLSIYGFHSHPIPQRGSNMNALQKMKPKHWITKAVVGSALLCSISTVLAAPPSPALTNAVEDAFQVDAFDLTNMEVPANLVDQFTSSFSYEGVEYVMEMTAHSIRSDHFQVLTPDDNGQLVPHAVPAPRTYRGFIDGIPGSIVSGSLIDGQFQGMVFVADGVTWEIDPLSQAIPGVDPNRYVIFASTDLRPVDGICMDVDPAQQGGTGLIGQTNGVQVGGGESTQSLKYAEVACDADFEFFQKNGSSIANTVTDIENIFAGLDTIYQRDVTIGYDITTIIVRDKEPDPYTSTDPGVLLNQFRSEWNSNQSGIQRDFAHMFTGKNINGGVIGIAFLSVICNLNNAYGLVQSRFTSNMTTRVCLSAHEIGHNWSAQHCDGNGDCRIMCSVINRCNRDCTSFGQSAKNQITSFKNSRSCLSDTLPFSLDLNPPPPIKGGTQVEWQAKHGQVGAKVALFYSVKGEGLTEVAPGIFIELKSPKLISPLQTLDGTGSASWSVTVPNINIRVFTQVVDEFANLTNIRFDDIVKQ